MICNSSNKNNANITVVSQLPCQICQGAVPVASEKFVSLDSSEVSGIHIGALGIFRDQRFRGLCHES